MTLRLLLTGLLALALLASPARAGEVDLPNDANAKLARVKAKMRAAESGKQGEKAGARAGRAGGAACGAVEIGNTATGGGRAPREITVVVTGDVINANNDCK
jgi:hypothetical protein